MAESTVDIILRWWEHPDQFVREVFRATPDAWQDEVLKAFPHKQRIAMKACKGPGKTTVECWLAWNFLATRPSPRIAATSITGDTLFDTLWPEMAYWMNKSDFLKAKFDWQKTRIVSKEAPETRWMSARSWPKGGSAQDQANTLAGLHADYIMFILDESGGMPDAVMVSAEAALSSCKEGHIIQSGNPTHLEGPLYRACTSARNLWHVVEITGDPDDPNRTPRMDIQWARDMIQQYGRDHSYVKVNVFGEFPESSLNSLIGPDEMSAAMKRSYDEGHLVGAPRILGVDVARFGDDSSVIFPRQGLVAFNPIQYRNLRSHEGAGAVARKWEDWGAHACFVDDTGGYGAGWIDALMQLRKAPIGVGFATQATDRRYYNKRTEMYFDCVNWIKRGGQLPNVPELTAAMTQTTYSFKGDRMLLEPKEMVKQRLGMSPDHADALCLTFAYPVSQPDQPSGHTRMAAEYDPFASMRTDQKRASRSLAMDYQPFGGRG